MRLLFVGTSPEPGGAASHFVSLTQALAAAGHQVAVVANPRSGIWRSLESAACVTLYAAEFTEKVDRRAMATVRRAIRVEQPEWIVAAFEDDYWGTALVGVIARVPVALFLHQAFLKSSSMRLLPRLVQRFLVPSQYMRRWAVTRGLPHDRVSVIYNPIDTHHFTPCREMRAVQRAALALEPDDVLVGFVGRLEPNKGPLVFAEALTHAMGRVPSLRALWVGFGTLESELDRLIAGSSHARRHTRRAWTDDPAQYYFAMDLLAMPSTGPEAFGRVSVEAQASGVPVLGSAIGGIGETMQDGVTGRLVTVGDVGMWTDAICEFAQNRPVRRGMAAAGPAFVRRAFDCAGVVETFVRALQEHRSTQADQPVFSTGSMVAST